MRRLAFPDLVLLGVVAPLWLLALAVHLDLLIDGRLAWAPVYVSPAEGPGGYPAVVGFWPGSDPGEAADAPTSAGDAVAIGDSLLAVDGVSLRGAGRLETLSAIYRGAHEPAAGAAPVAVVQVERDGARREVRLVLEPVAVPWRALPLVVLGLTGVVAILRGGGRRAARAYALAAFVYGMHWSFAFGAGSRFALPGLAAFLICGALFPPLIVRAVLSFPEATAPRTSIARIAPWSLLAFGPALASWLLGVPFSGEFGLRAVFALNFVFLGTVLGLLAWNYRRAEPAGRRQLRWVLYGFYVGLAPVLVAAAVALLGSDLEFVYDYALVTVAAIPPFVLIAIVRDDLLDIDRLISATAAYSLLSVLFLGAIFTFIPELARVASEASGLEPAWVQAGLGIGLAGLLIRGERLVRPPLERLFFRERHELEVGVRVLRGELGGFEEPASLYTAVGERLESLLGLRTCAVYARAGDVLTPVHAAGPLIPPGFAVAGRLAGLLEDAEGPVDTERWRRWARRGLIDGPEEAALESLGAELLLPIRRGDELAAFVSLGEKGSEDIYTPLDVSLLEGLADRMAAELQRFDIAVMEEAERRLNQKLAGYVPAAVVSALEHDAGMERGTIEATILFVDIRGYTKFSESRDADEIFRVVNAYTTAVSEVVRRFGGAVVEFHGDGLLAVFGAPDPLPEKERSAVEAGLAIVDTVETGEVEGLSGLGLAVGVGIATGEVYCGDIQSIDRRIWSVIGNTTNLAARLQGLTRDLEATLVIGETTWQRCGPAASGFVEHDGVRIRGRSDPMPIFARPREERAAA